MRVQELGMIHPCCLQDLITEEYSAAWWEKDQWECRECHKQWLHTPMDSELEDAVAAAVGNLDIEEAVLWKVKGSYPLCLLTTRTQVVVLNVEDEDEVQSEA